MAYEDMRRQTLFGNIANNLIAAGTGGQQVSPAQALQALQDREFSKKRMTLQDSIMQSKEQRLKTQTEMERKAAEAAAAQQAKIRATLGQIGQPQYGPTAGNYSTGQPLSGGDAVNRLTQIGALDEATKLSGLQPSAPKYDVKTMNRDGVEETWLTANGQPVEKLSDGPQWSPNNGPLVTNVFPDKKDPGAWKRADKLEESLVTDRNALSTINDIRTVVSRSGEKVLGAGGSIRAALAPLATMIGADSAEMGDAQLVKALFSNQAGSLRSLIIGTGQVSDYEQKLLAAASGGGIAGLKAINELLGVYEEKAAEKYNRNRESLSSVVDTYGLAGYGSFDPYEIKRPAGEKVEAGQTFKTPPPRDQWPQGTKLQRNPATGEYRFAPAGGN